MARIVRFHSIGGPEVLQIDEIETPPLNAGEIKIRVKAIGLNRAEAMFRSGRYFGDPELPSKLGYEASGIIEDLGPGVSGFSIGDAVSIVPPHDQGVYGVYGEVAVVPEKYVVKHPSSLSFVDAAALWMQYLTAYGALIDIAKIQKGDYVIIPAASSSVGLAAIQLCHAEGAIPIALTRTSKKRKALEEAGATFVITSQEENIAARILEITSNKGARVAFDPVGGKTVLELAKAMSESGIIFEYGALSGEHTPFPLMMALLKSLTMRGYVLFEIVRDEERFEKGKKYILDLLEAEKIKPIIAKTFPFDEIVDAHRYLESNEQFGKIVVTL